LVLSSRDPELHDPSTAAGEPAVRWWALPDDLVRLPLGPLPEDDTRELAARLIDRAGLATLDASAVAGDAAGHPLLLQELVTYAATSGDAGGEHPRLDDVIRARAGALRGVARDLVDLVMRDGRGAVP
jgi:hypothetical protein